MKALLRPILLAASLLLGCEISDSTTTTYVCDPAPLGCQSGLVEWRCDSERGPHANPCASGEVCTGGACHPRTCSPGMSVCATDGQIRQYCDVNGIAGAERCPVFCSGGSCINPPCNSCQGDWAIGCNGSPFVDCGAKGQLCQGGKCVAESAAAAKPLICPGLCSPQQWCDVAESPPACKDLACALPKWSGGAGWRVAQLRLMAAGQGCDLNGDGKVDNGLALALGAKVADQNAALQGSILDGQIGVVLRLWPSTGLAVPAGLDWLVASRPAQPCADGSGISCPATISLASLDVTKAQPVCSALAQLPLASAATATVAYGPTSQLVIPYFAGPQLNLRAASARIEVGDTVPQGKKLRLCGWFTAASMQAGVRTSPNRSQFGGAANAQKMLRQSLPFDLNQDGLGHCTQGPKIDQPCATGSDCGPAVLSCESIEALSFAYELVVTTAVLGEIQAP